MNLPTLAATRLASLRLAGGRVVAADDALVLAGGDTLVLSGLPEAQIGRAHV